MKYVTGTKSVDPHTTVVTCQGEMDSLAVEELHQAVDPLLGDSVSHLVFDLGAVEYISSSVLSFLMASQAKVKKKELVGNFAKKGQEWHPGGHPAQVRTRDCPDKVLGKVIPYGVYDPAANVGWVSVGIDHDTAAFATESLRRWWEEMGQVRYRDATELLVTAHGGGSNGRRSRLWQVGLQQLADQIGLRLSICHFPPGTSKWNKIEPRMFCHITTN